MKYSIVIPHLSNSTCIESCIKYIKQNSIYENEIITIVDETDVYYAFNKGVYASSCDTVVLLNDDMMVAKDWDKYIPIFSNQSTILTGHVVEPTLETHLIRGYKYYSFDCGKHINNFNYKKFEEYVKNQSVPEIEFNSIGWVMPMVVNKKTFVTFPNIKKFPVYWNDMLLVDDIMPFVGFKFGQIDMWVYHFSRHASNENISSRKCIFSYCNHQINPKISVLQQNVIEKLNKTQNCIYEFLKYNGNDGEVFPDQAIDYAFDKLFYQDNYDIILMLDIDCIPLNSTAIQYVFDRAAQGVIVGNIQRSNHINNDEHVYVAPSAICISKNTFEKLGKPSFKPTIRSDIGEELCFIAEEHNVPLEMFLPSEYEKLPLNEQLPWNLRADMPKYGIGTTFVNCNNDEMFYHLFQSRFHNFNQLFYNKCISILTDGIYFDNIDMYSFYKNYLCQQVSTFKNPFEKLIKEIKPELIIEIGTGQGGFSIFLNDLTTRLKLKCKQITYDINNNNDIILKYNQTTNNTIEFHIKDIFDDIDYLTELINSSGTTLILCDGGNKVKEFQTFSKLIKKDDFIMGHDYAETTQFFDDHIYRKIWNWLELSGESIQEDIKKNNLIHYMKEEFSKIVWICMKKS